MVLLYILGCYLLVFQILLKLNNTYQRYYHLKPKREFTLFPKLGFSKTFLILFTCNFYVSGHSNENIFIFINGDHIFAINTHK